MRIPVIGTTLAIVAALVTYIVVLAPAAVLLSPGPAAVADAAAPGAVTPAPEKGSRLPRLSGRPVTGITGSTTAGTVHQRRYTLDSIIAGRHDRYIDAFARSIGRYPHRVILRFMHEMNGFWYPWAAGANGNTPAQYVQAWRHVHDRFAGVGTDNVRWMWAPNAVYHGAGALASLYPGNAYVDLVGISTYNWGVREHDGVRTRWQPFGSLLEPTLQRLQCSSCTPPTCR